MYSFTQSGDWFYPDSYNTWIALCLAVAAIYFVLSYLVGRHHALTGIHAFSLHHS